MAATKRIIVKNNRNLLLNNLNLKKKIVETVNAKMYDLGDYSKQ